MTDYSSIDAELWLRLQECARYANTSAIMHKVSSELGITPAATKVLRIVKERESVQMSDLAQILTCDPSNVTFLVDTLEKAQMVERTHHPTDRRIKLVRLTDLGEEAHTEILRALAVPPVSLSAVSNDDKLVMLRVLDALHIQVAGDRCENSASA